jgi:hypothetical protein
LALAAYAVHILEEFMFERRNWARAVIGLPVEWSDFYVTNSVVVMLGIAQAGLAPTLAIGPLTFAALVNQEFTDYFASKTPSRSGRHPLSQERKFRI